MTKPGGWCGYVPSYILTLSALRLSAIVGLALGTIAVIVISIKSYSLLKGRGFAIVGIMAAAVSLILGRLELAPRPAPPSPGMVCAGNLYGLGKAMMIYANDYNNQYPTAKKWCDLLVMYSEVRPVRFVCKSSDAKKGESSYAMNKNVIGKRVSEIPEDVVVLFETIFGKNPEGRQEVLGNRDWYKKLSSLKDRWDFDWIKKYRHSEKVYKLRWNQFGGPELLTTENHNGEGCNILFNDGSVKFVKAEDIGELKWDFEGVRKGAMGAEENGIE